MESLYVCMTMDVERVREFSPIGGPPTWEFGERSVRSYCEFLAAEGLPATLFVVPDSAVEQGAVLRQIAGGTGAELGMHIHPDYWGDHCKNPEVHDCLGGYVEIQQRDLLARALAEVEAELRRLAADLDLEVQGATLDLVRRDFLAVAGSA